MKIPVNLYYSSEHLWIKAGEDGVYLAGITDYAQDLLGDIVFVDAPKVGTSLKANEVCGLIESVKTGSDSMHHWMAQSLRSTRSCRTTRRKSTKTLMTIGFSNSKLTLQTLKHC
jgi:hypothetical protein